jgi:serine/threonine protein phosphatase PrpC
MPSEAFECSCSPFLAFSFVKDKKTGEGEDAPPVLCEKGNHFYVAVFDGLGGSGSERYSFTGADGARNELTGAYLAARYAANVVLTHFKQLEDDKNWLASSEQLKLKLTDTFNRIPAQFGVKPTRLKSNMSRQFPTTMALLAVEVTEYSEPIVDLVATWAGDSRCYLLDEVGLQVLSADDVTSEAETLVGLAKFTQDGVIKNCICSDRPFYLNTKRHTVTHPAIVLVATDGCFGYLPTPAHFEREILLALLESESMEQWSQSLCDRLAKVASDDLSMGLVAIGFQDLNHCKSYFNSRLNDLTAALSPLISIEEDTSRLNEEIKDIEHRLKTLNEKKEHAFQSMWRVYGDVYEGRLL